MLYSLGALNTFLITSLFSLLLICGLSRQNQLGSDKERGRDVHNQVIKKSRDFLYIWNICSQSWREEEGRLEFGVWGFCLFFLKTLVFANVWKDFMVPKYCLAQDDTEYVNVPAIFWDSWEVTIETEVTIIVTLEM